MQAHSAVGKWSALTSGFCQRIPFDIGIGAVNYVDEIADAYSERLAAHLMIRSSILEACRHTGESLTSVSMAS